MILNKRLTHFFLGMIIILLLAACEAAGEQPPVDGTPTIDPGLPPAAALEAQAWLAEQLDADETQVNMINAEQAEWSDSCLGLGQPNESCAAVITPGWDLLFEVEGQQYEVRTDETGAIIRSPQITAEMEPPAAPEVTPEVTEDVAEEPAGDALANTQWQLESFGPVGAETPAVADSPVTLQFEEGGQAGGNGGCNSYGTEYEVQDGTLSFGETVSTLIACADDAINEQEQQYFQALETAGEFELSEDRLTIFYNNGESVLNFVRVTGDSS